MQGLCNGVSIILSTGYCIGSIAAMFLNATLPADPGLIKVDAPMVKPSPKEADIEEEQAPTMKASPEVAVIEE